MKKGILIILILAGLFFSCKEPSNGFNDDDLITDKTTIVFDNTQGICNVIVYVSPDRNDEVKITEITAGKLSDEFDWTDGSMIFFFSYKISIKGVNSFSYIYVPALTENQTLFRVDANKKNIIPIPVLDDKIVSPDTLLSNNSFVIIQNDSLNAVKLLYNNNELQSDNTGDTEIKSGEYAHYSISNNDLNQRQVSRYKLTDNGNDFLFASSIDTFEKGQIYSFVYDGKSFFQTAQIEIKLGNIEVTRDILIPVSPAKPLISASADGQLVVRWTAVACASRYEVFIDTKNTPPSSPVKTVTGSTTIIDGLTNGVSYYIWVKAVNSSGSSDFSPYVRGIPWQPNQIPEIPETPVIIPGVNNITVIWEDTAGAASYEIFISESENISDVPAVETEKTSAVIYDLENNKDYYIWIRAVNSAGKSNFSLIQIGTPQEPTEIPSVPARPILTAGNNEIFVSWQAVKNAVSYEVWFGISNNSSSAQKFGADITQGKTDTVITGLTNGTTYYVWIRAKNNIGLSNFSTSASISPSAFTVPPSAPSSLIILSGRDKELNISWQSADGALFYEIWVSKSGDLNSALKYGPDISGTSIVISNLENGTVYYLWVRAKNNSGVGGFSDSASGMPEAFSDAPSALQTAPSVVAGNKSLTVSWQSVQMASVYEIWIGTTNVSQDAKYEKDISGLSVVITGLENYTAYYIWIKAKNSVGASGFSPAGNGTPRERDISSDKLPAPVLVSGYERLTVTWEAAADATAYEVWYNETNNSSSARQYASNLTESQGMLSVTISGLTNGTMYYVWIKAKNSISVTDFSASANAAPEFIITARASNMQVTLSWEQAPGAGSYQIFYSTENVKPASASVTVSTAPYTITQLHNGTTYYFWVIPVKSGIPGSISKIAAGKPVGNMGTVSASLGTEQLSLNWAEVTGADNYEVYVSTSAGIPSLPNQIVSETNTVISNLINGTTYNIWIKPVNDTGAGNTNTMLSRKPIGQMSAVTVTPDGDGRLSLSWEAVAGADQYEVYNSTENSIPLSFNVVVSTALSVFTNLTNGATYYFWVKPRNSGGVYGEAAANGIPIGIPAGLALTSGNTQITLSWSSVDYASGYDIFYSTESTIPEHPSEKITGALSKTFTNLTNGRVYYFWVKAVNAKAQAGKASSVISGKPIGNIGTVNTALNGSGSLALSWTAVPGADQYDVYYSNNTVIPNNSSLTVSTNTAVISGLSNGTDWYVWVRPKNTNGYSNLSAMVSGIPIGTPANIKVSSGNGFVTLNWEASGAVDYEIFYSTSSAIPAQSNITVNEQTAQITGLMNGTVYYFWIKGINADGLKTPASAVVNCKPLGNMGTVTANPAASGELILSWAAVAGADEYDVYYKTVQTQPDGTSQAELTTSNESVIVANLVNGTTYYIWVKPKNTNGSGNMSSMAVGIPIASVGNINVESGNGQVTLSWSSVLGATGYDVYYSTDTVIPDNSHSSISGSTATIQITGLINGNSYYFWVKAKNSQGLSGSASPMAMGVAGYGLYKITGNTKSFIGSHRINDALNYINTNAVNNDKYMILLTINETVTEKTLNYSGKNVEITLFGGGNEITLTQSASGNIFIIGSGAVLNLDNITLAGNNSNSSARIQINASGSFKMNDGSKIIGASTGNGVNVSGGTFTMNNGTIKTNSRGVNITDTGTFTMNNGTISNNISGGVNVSGTGIFIINDGVISENNSSTYGGGVSVNGGSFTMNGGAISNNSVEHNTYGYGGGVYIAQNAAFTMTGGRISNNKAKLGGGGLFSVGTTNFSGGSISSNKTDGTGGGVVLNGGTFTMSGGVINGNSAADLGGGVFIWKGTFRKQAASGSNQSGIIYGSSNNSILANVAINNFHSIGYNSSSTQATGRNDTLGETVNITFTGYAN